MLTILEIVVRDHKMINFHIDVVLDGVITLQIVKKFNEFKLFDQVLEQIAKRHNVHKPELNSSSFNQQNYQETCTILTLYLTQCLQQQIY